MDEAQRLSCRTKKCSRSSVALRCVNGTCCVDDGRKFNQVAAVSFRSRWVAVLPGTRVLWQVDGNRYRQGDFLCWARNLADAAGTSDNGLVFRIEIDCYDGGCICGMTKLARICDHRLWFTTLTAVSIVRNQMRTQVEFPPLRRSRSLVSSHRR